ncbi:MAG: UDP-N-acetylglucosamine--N-acetylmuramyl-(pentapeptide) pyrophosphoryl-undecaprenol N-acetylglucosamine transferase [Candidatus Peregrinibacteria bacterium]|nr:UDP-N-acetylglucosamine--N-acetylmuramyl-(pentapeptide) pyrophosphoryl-undecaprenol N-acetylglucosamine transferase [Candidatus Peregrinibacteria bacterium]
MKILFCGGGSVGHLAPAIAVWRAVQRSDPSAEALFVPTEKDADAAYLIAEDVPYQALPALRSSWKLPWDFLRTYRRARKQLTTFAPNAVFSKGGALSIPICLAARRLHIPIVHHESDAVMGRASRIIARIASAVCLGFPPDEEALRGGMREYAATWIYTGNPVRPQITNGDRREGLALTRFRGEKPVLIVIGGSQGAEAINTFIESSLTALLPLVDIIHLTGKGKTGAKGQHAGYWSQSFATNELPHLYAASTIALSRAGAGSISELAMNGIPTVLVPLRGLAQDHQFANAKRMERSGGCIILEQGSLTREFPQLLRSLLTHGEKLEAMSQRMRAAAAPDAAERLSEIVLRSAARRVTNPRG